MRPDAEELTLNRRDFLQAGLAAAATALLPEMGRAAETRPNFLILLTDQTRHPMHWPEGWVERNLPSWTRLKKHGLTFNQAFCAASQCSPSRACLMTGAYSNLNGCQLVGGVMKTPGQGAPNLATMLRAAGYDVVYKGKWHLSHPVNGRCWTEADIEHLRQSYGMSGWNPPDAGSTAFVSGPEDYASIATLGGGHPDNDGRYVRGTTPGCECGPLENVESAPDQPKTLQFVPKAQCQAAPPPGQGCQTRGFGESVLEYLERAGKDGKPFCLIVSLVNPHDLVFYPEATGYPAVGYRPEDEGIELPPNRNDPLTQKPEVQTTYRKAIGTDSWDEERQRGYVNFYAYLHRVVDRHIEAVLDALDRHGLTRDTIVFRTADHGELGLSHGLVEKAYCVYEEGLHVPLIVSNPKLFPQGRETSAIWSHVDLTATLAALAGAEPIGVGVDQAPVLKGEKASARDAALFAFDDIYPAGIKLTAPASHIRALRTDRYTYAVYFTASYAGTPGGSAISAGPPFAFELYDHELDPLELVNMTYQPVPSTRILWESLHARLTEELDRTSSRPPGWPENLAAALP